jgi:hypothetical protein
MAVRHTCDDYNAWKPVFDEARTLREEYGAAAEMVFHNGNDVLVLVEMADAGSAERFQADPRLRDDMQKAGVRGSPDVGGPSAPGVERSEYQTSCRLRVGAVLGVCSGGSRPGIILWAGGSAGWSLGNQFGEVDERIAQMLRRERRESDVLSDGVRDC